MSLQFKQQSDKSTIVPTGTRVRTRRTSNETHARESLNAEIVQMVEQILLDAHGINAGARQKSFTGKIEFHVMPKEKMTTRRSKPKVPR